MRATLSACLIVMDEEERLPACLASLAFCDELVVVDSGSTDRTREIAAAAGAKVIEHPWAGFGAQRNVAIDHATSDWIIEIDADERVTPELAAELERFRADPPADADLAMLPMRHRFLGRMLGPTGHFPFHRPRLFRRGAYRHNPARTVHEGLPPRERPLLLSGEVHHELAGSLREAVRDAWAYAKLEARQLHDPSPRAALLGLTVRPVVKAAYVLVGLGGWRDGLQGLVKIKLECLSDMAVWVLYLARGGRFRSDGSAGHFGTPSEEGGPRRVLAVAAGARAAGAAEAHLARLEATGLWTTLITDAPPASSRIDVHRVRRVGPLLLMRALDAERQARELDELVPFGRRARLAVRLVPGPRA